MGTSLAHPSALSSPSSAIARGLIAGTVGTVIMTLSERLEMSMSGRQASTVPGQVGASVLPGASPGAPGQVRKLNGPTHWAHGIGMGLVRSAVARAGLRGPSAAAAHFALLWGGDAALYRALGLADVPWRWERRELATDLLHKGVYAAATGAAYSALAKR